MLIYLNNYIVPGPGAPPPPPPPPNAPLVAPSITTNINPLGNNAGRKSSSYQAKQKLKYVEWEKMNLINIKHTVWNHLDKTATESIKKDNVSIITTNTSDTTATAFEKSLEYKLADAGVFDAIEKAFAQKPVAEIKKSRKKEQAYIIDSKKAYTLSKFKVFLSSIKIYLLIYVLIYYLF